MYKFAWRKEFFEFRTNKYSKFSENYNQRNSLDFRWPKRCHLYRYSSRHCNGYGWSRYYCSCFHNKVRLNNRWSIHISQFRFYEGFLIIWFHPKSLRTVILSIFDSFRVTWFDTFQFLTNRSPQVWFRSFFTHKTSKTKEFFF